ncbi:superfamily II DNA or RNA helicase [Agromyces flavus]|uniref:Helicase conserved C-terminal domain-containing protein n=1 Tax=Agromyces flavus TaxID=589382 RepID=A0A1H1L5S8_9MICO|nr:DEAD/DEAH box helicase [Agromyces flavus]MCP2367443.1 superfamily II DNA or RNA helicase [Agromyces flavus]SDR69898.1 Helicase conserved C-terminal domain-containing protein [Agromyces flavus]
MPADPLPPAGAARDWRSALAAMGSPADASPVRRADGAPADERTTTRRLGLQFELRRRVQRRNGEWRGPRDEPARRAVAVDRLAVRPVTQGSRGAWIKGGLTWQNIGFQASAAGVDPAQSRWFAQFAMLKGSGPSLQVYGSEWITVDDFESPLLWALLDEAGRLGIALVGSDATPEVALRGGAVIGLDAAAGADGALTLTPILTLDADDHALEHARPVAGHGVYRFDFDAGLIELAPYAGGLLGPAEAAVLSAPEPIRVPAAEVADFATSHFHALAGSIAVTSRDGSFAPPPRPPATLVLDARFESGDVLRLAWRWEHADGRTTEVDPSAAVDDPQLDDDLLARVGDELGWVPLDAIVLRGVDAAQFTAERMPRLEALAARAAGASFRIDVRGERPDYREATERPEVRVTTVETDQPDWFDLGVVITVNGRPVPFMRLFRALAKGQKRMLLVDKSYLSLTQPIFAELRELIEEAGDLAEWETGRLPIYRSRTSLWADFEDLADVAEPAVTWRATVAALEGGRVEELAPPEELALPLRPYQLAGFRWLAYLWANRLGGVLADDMGLGKTVQCLALIQHATAARTSADGVDGAPFLVVAPTSVASNWIHEAARFTPGLRVASVSGTQATQRRRLADVAARADVVVTTYAVLRLEADAFAELDWGGLILDEAQFVKNAATKVHDAARAIRAPFRLAVTGTPLENHLGDLWAILRIVAPGLFPSRRGFDERYRRPVEDDRNAERLDRLRRRIRPLVLRRTKEAVAPELPPKQEQVLEVELAPEHRRLYDVVLQRERQKLLGLVDDLDRQRFIVYRSITLLRMLALDATLIDAERHAGIPSAKLDALFEQLDDVLAEGHRALVFSQFTSFLGRVAGRLDAAGVPYAYLDGSTTARRRDDEIARFRSGAASVFCISLKAGGFGLNLTEADYVFLLDPWWNPASEAQAVDRAHRIGQKQHVMVYRLVAAGTIEEKVMALKARKGALAASVLDDGLGSAQLDADDLRELLEG